MELEPNNIITEAIATNVSSTLEQTLTVSGSVDLLSDVDLYKFQLDRGQGITLDIDTVNADNDRANFDSYLRVFDGNGNQLAFNDDFSLESEDFSVDSYIGFIANETGEYYVGVSSIANTIYNPVNGDSPDLLRNSFIPGDYNLSFNLVEVIADEDVDNTISEAIAINIDDSGSSLTDSAIELESDADIFKVELAQGEGIKLRVNAKAIDSELDSYLRVFDGDGNEVAFDDNSLNNPGADASDITTDSTIDFAPPTPGEYFIGVSSAGNFDYDPINGDTNINLSPNNGFSRGDYQLQADIVEVVPDEDPDNTIAEAIDSEISSSEERKGVFAGTIDPELDVDIFQVQLDEGDGIYLDLDAAILDSELNSFLRIFDFEGNELTFDDNDDTNFTGDLNLDSAIAFAPSAPGEYFIGVSASGNFDYDAVNGRTNFSSNVTSPFSTIGNYELKIDLANIIADEDTDNTISEAIESNVSSTGETSAVLTQAIDAASDVDLYQFQLDAGEGIALNINAAAQESDLDSYLRLFDFEGNELAFDDDDDRNIEADDTTADSLLNFVAETSGEYYIGVSSEGNTTYDPINGSTNFSNTSGFSTGNYELSFDISPVIPDEDSDNTISEAINTGITSVGKRSTTIDDAIASTSDVDIYQFKLNQGDTITLDIDAAIQESDLDSVLRLFDSSGSEIANNDDGMADDETSSTDSLIDFTAEVDGEYYLGVSSFANFEYDPINGSTNFSNDLGTSLGDYNLTISIAEI
ncbi:PPC domain-containing protein [Waterburya agarophytonicola K14]|uniref:PPC domain-containing protein n=1 Tax=Waterburya agarophytonicola KI4 TaxID=2874699 RepID=A0A964FKW9_9CYAN|nr:DVUA0089 family protein [Waterburya agarophytonicola]MCC0179023.1 PPC domain-containing protein [Waterburya agarophytonicola KI4]